MRRTYRASQDSIDWAVNRGWAYSRQEFSDWLADVFNACSERSRPFVAVIVPRSTAQVEFTTSTMVPDAVSPPKIADAVLDDIRERATILQKNSRSRTKEIHFDAQATGGTIHGLREDDAKYLAHYITQRLNDPATYFTGKVTPLFTQEDDIA